MHLLKLVNKDIVYGISMAGCKFCIGLQSTLITTNLLLHCGVSHVHRQLKSINNSNTMRSNIYYYYNCENCFQWATTSWQMAASRTTMPILAHEVQSATMMKVINKMLPLVSSERAKHHGNFWRYTVASIQICLSTMDSAKLPLLLTAKIDVIPAPLPPQLNASTWEQDLSHMCETNRWNWYVFRATTA